MHHLYSHTQGIFHLAYDAAAFQLEVTEGNRESIVPIGPAGLIELGLKLISIGHDLNCTGVVTDISVTQTPVDAATETEKRDWAVQVNLWLKGRPYDPNSGGPLDELSNLIEVLTQKLELSKAVYQNNGVLPRGV